METERQKYDIIALMTTVSKLSFRAQEIILGSLLGDGSLAINKNYLHPRFSFRHSIIQKEYFFWKVKAVKEISNDADNWIQGKNGKDGWGTAKFRYQSKATALLDEVYRLTHKGKLHTKIVVRRKWLNLLSPLSLAIWWCDDGSLVADSRQGVFCTDSFSLAEVKILDRYLKKVWGVTTSIFQVKGTEHYRLGVRSTADLQKFLRIILPHIPVIEMLPKVILLYRDSDLQQRWISEIISLTSFTRREVLNQLELKRNKWKKFRK